MKHILSAAALAMCALAAPAAEAEGIGAEANYGRASGRWGAELGAGYAFGVAGFRLTPGGGVYLRDGGTALYGRVEASYTLPGSLTLGGGVRIAGNTRPYATVAMPILPLVHVKGNAGPKYLAIGLTVGY